MESLSDTVSLLSPDELLSFADNLVEQLNGEIRSEEFEEKVKIMEALGTTKELDSLFPEISSDALLEISNNLKNVKHIEPIISNNIPKRSYKKRKRTSNEYYTWNTQRTKIKSYIDDFLEKNYKLDFEDVSSKLLRKVNKNFTLYMSMETFLGEYEDFISMRLYEIIKKNS